MPKAVRSTRHLSNEQEQANTQILTSEGMATADAVDTSDELSQ